MRTKFIYSYGDASFGKKARIFQDELNNCLKELDGCKIIDIKYNSSRTSSSSVISAIVMYEPIESVVINHITFYLREIADKVNNFNYDKWHTLDEKIEEVVHPFRSQYPRLTLDDIIKLHSVVKKYIEEE